MQPLVSVVLVNWNGLEDTKLCLKHTFEQTYANFEVIVVDNGSHDGSVAYLRKQKNIVLVELPKNTGFTGGHIAGYNVSKGKYILLLNNDAVMDRQYIEKAVATIEESDDIAVVGGRAYFWNDENPLFDATNDFYAYQNINPISGEGIFTRQDAGSIQEVNNVSGSCVMVKRSVIEELGYLHDPFFAYYEESDLFARIKRAGYKVIYNPELAIWHANGKSAERKGSTFSFYMMMRNRYRFAIRNFDGWALRRFLRFYIKLGLVSTVKALLKPKTHPMEKAYMRAFFHNVFFGWQAFAERRQLKKLLGTSRSYNQQIIREQTGISLVLVCTSKKQVDDAVTLSKQLATHDEIVIVVKTAEIAAYAKKFCSIVSSPLRLCIDQGFFKTDSWNLGAICAKNDWLLYTSVDDAMDLSLFNHASTAAYRAFQKGGRLIYASAEQEYGLSHSCEHAAQVSCSRNLLIHKDVFMNGRGLVHGLTHDEALRSLMIFAAISKTLFGIHYNSPATLPALDDAEKLTSTVGTMRAAYAESVAASKKPSLWGRYLIRHYHTQQVTNFFVWWLSPGASLYLKLARTKNILLAIATLNRSRLATELKHIRNELLRSKYMVVADLDKRKAEENKRLQYLLKHPQETTIFIICRDRYETLKQLLDWFEKQGMRRIVLIDNDSALPPLIDYLKTTPYQVLEMRRNVGHTVLWSAGIIKILLPDDFYLLSDPDVIPSMDNLDVVTHLYAVHADHPDHLKVGLGLKIDDLSDKYDLKKEVISWESQFWKHQYAPGVFEAGVDTTFAVYKPYTYQYFIHPSLRTDEPYTGRHLPWYGDSKNPSDEEIFYRLRADQNVNTWNKGKLPDRYIKELEKQRH